MLKVLLVLSAFLGCLNSEGLGEGPTPGEGEVQTEKKQARRNLGFAGYPFLPLCIPYRVVEVHHLVMLQPPTCGGTSPQYPAVQPAFPPFYQPQQPGPYPQYIPQRPGMPQYPPFQPPVTQPPPTQPPQKVPGGIEDRMNTNGTALKRPSRCVWAIVACCSPDSSAIRYSCFELLGCPGAFWGVNPCEPTVVQAAANTALNYYMAGGQEEPQPDTNNL